ncbi:uncharacterized protein LOC116116555 [Pistacia vera]|uniref:uncharacterized protein LOC116116555 n=1 Tax=Pistacia vera TaxID=55513 RepID=UPI001262BB99|nr:uncharacterized protein LOC116116555 [Pistacia vera]
MNHPPRKSVPIGQNHQAEFQHGAHSMLRLKMKQCVKQHIIEARQELEIYLGKEKLVELGFHDMGEVVANNWSNGEEQMFHKIVYSNPASLGRNFWSILSAVFPSRRKRYDDYGGNETGMSADDDDDDSVLSHPHHPDMRYQSHEDDLRIYERMLKGEKGDREVQDDSCTSSDTAAAAQDPGMIEEVFGDGSWNFKVRDGKLE